MGRRVLDRGVGDDRPQPRQEHHAHRERRRVEEHRRPRTRAGDQQAGDRGPGNAGHREAQPAQRVGGLQLARVRDRLGQQAGERGLEERLRGPVGRGERAERHRRGRAGDEQHAAGGLDEQPGEVGHDEHAAPVAAIREHAADEREDQERDQLRGDDEADRPEPAAGLEHRERQRHQHDPVADDRQHLAAEQQPELRLDPQAPQGSAAAAISPLPPSSPEQYVA